MSKYIDAEKLKAEIEFSKSVYSHPNRVVYGIADAFRQDGRAAMCNDILATIDSLQQEEPGEKKSNALFDKAVENCDPAVMKEVFDNVDKMLGRQAASEGLEEDEK